MGFKMLRKERREAGLALILAIGFLGLLSILGAVVMRVATMDLSSTTTTLPNQRALYAADRAVEYSMNRDIIINLLPYTKVNLKDDFVKTGGGVNQQTWIIGRKLLPFRIPSLIVNFIQNGYSNLPGHF